MKQRIMVSGCILAITLTLAGCGNTEIADDVKSVNKNMEQEIQAEQNMEGTEGDIHYNVYIPDSYDGSEPTRKAYHRFHELYEKEGLSQKEIDRLLVLDIKKPSYFAGQGITNQHGGGGVLFSRDEEIMGWLFGQTK